MRELLEARVEVPHLPWGGRVLDRGASLVLRRRRSGWHLEAPLHEEVFPLAQWLRDQGILDEIQDSVCLAIEALPDGRVSLQLQASREAIERFFQWIGPDVRDRLRVRLLTPAEVDAPTLTDLQDDALRRAVALGYYRIPRSIHLSELAGKLGVSPAALSERLRRAEARLVTHYLGHSSTRTAGDRVDPGEAGETGKAGIGAED